VDEYEERDNSAVCAFSLTDWWAQSQASRSRLSTIAGLAYPVIPPRITKQRVRDQLACLASATGVRRIARLGGGPLLRHGVRARPFDLAAADRLLEPLRVRAPALARAGTHRRCPPPFRLCRCRRAYPMIEATARRTENAKVRNRRLQKKVCFGVPSPSGAQDQRAARAIPSNRHLHWLQFNGTATKPRLSVFCSNRQLYAVLADDHNKKILFYGSTLQKSICGDPPCTIVVGKPSCSSSEIYNPAEKDIIIHTKVLEVATVGLGGSRFSRRSAGPLSSGVPRGGGAGRGARLLSGRCCLAID
jgi:hypothetical protein